MNSLRAVQISHLAAAGVCPKAPPGVQQYSDEILSWVKWGALSIIGIGIFISIILLVWGRVTHHPKGARLGFDGIVVYIGAAILYVVAYVVITSITGSGC